MLRHDSLFHSLGARQGWGALSNYVLRCHIPLIIPGEETCGMIVRDETKYHQEGEIIVFDDSLEHSAFNDSKANRWVLIIDIARPPGWPLGEAEGEATEELQGFIQHFK